MGRWMVGWMDGGVGGEDGYVYRRSKGGSWRGGLESLRGGLEQKLGEEV